MQSVTPQNRHIESLTQEFLSVHWDRKKPLLIAYSGGPDSKALLYALIECGVAPHIAHVDHGWREESKEQALDLKAEAESLGCPFFSTRLVGAKKEDEARSARYDFFSTLAPKYAGIFIAHTLGDLAETVLKRVLEGAHLSNLGGMKPVSKRGAMNLWRPLLNVTRAQILEYLSSRSLCAINDPTNSDPTFLRARMRREILPLINQWFGKETFKNLALLSTRSYELQAYLELKTCSLSKEKGPWGTIFNLGGLEPIEVRYQLQRIAKESSLTFSRPVIETILKWVLSKEKSKQIIVKRKKIFVDNQRVWVFSEGPNTLEPSS